VAEPAVETLTDHQLLAMCDAALAPDEQDDLTRLLAANRDGVLDAPARECLDALMAAYRRGLILKNRAVRKAVSRGHKPRLSEDAA
jgi:hypothetical protein